MTVTLFEHARATEPKGYWTLEELVKRIQSPPLSVMLPLQQARKALAEGNQEGYAAAKRMLPAVAIAGKFEKRRNNGLLEHSGLMPIDLDHLSQEELQAARAKIEADPHCALLFMSPSGAGLKGAFRVNRLPRNDSEHKTAFRAVKLYIEKTYALELDPACKDAARLAFLSHDPEVYSNPAALPLPIEEWETQDEPAHAPEAGALPPELVVYTDNDAGRAERFCDRFKDEIRFIPDRGFWLVWEGRWQRDVLNGLKRRAVQLANEMILDVVSKPAKGEKELKDQADMIKKASRWGNHSTITPMLALAEAIPWIQARVTELDEDPFLLGTPNAIIDLRTGIASEHKPEQLITMATRAVYDPDAQAPRWEKFIEEVFPDPEVRRYVWKAAGYSITGDMGEECFFLCHNSGRNGKSKFIGAIDYVLGDYADTAGQGLVIASERGDDPKREKAKIVGKRFLRAPETEGRQRLNIRTVKDITGGDPLDAEAKFEHPFTFKPVCKLWWACNQKPDVKDIGVAIWERVRLIPFERYFAPEERDPALEGKLQMEASGILKWLIQGAILWQKEGLVPPAKVVAAVEEYRREEDALADFIEECTMEDPTELTPHSKLFHRYEEWARESGIRYPMTKKQLSKALREKGWAERRTAQSFTNWVGIALS